MFQSPYNVFVYIHMQGEKADDHLFERDFIRDVSELGVRKRKQMVSIQ